MDTRPQRSLADSERTEFESSAPTCTAPFVSPCLQTALCRSAFLVSLSDTNERISRLIEQ